MLSMLGQPRHVEDPLGRPPAERTFDELARPRAGRGRWEIGTRHRVWAGDDAHRLAGVGFKVTAFDLSPTAIDWARERFGNANPTFEAANLFQPPAHYHQAFDFVFEAYTWQALPPEIRSRGISQVAEFVAPGGNLLVVGRARDEDATLTGPPWPLARSEFDPLLHAGLHLESFEDFIDSEQIRRFRLLLKR